jgi:protein-L-isoaspartate(D-aspartate) O-methyltransferase
MNKKEMIKSVKEYLSHFKEPNKTILNALEKVDRKKFIDVNKQLVYEDEAIPIGLGQTISQPSTVARMISLLQLKKSDKVLEIGTGSAWNAALMAYMAKKVITYEIVEQLIEKSKKRLKKLKIKNIEIRQGDFRKTKEKFNKIIFTAGVLKDDEKKIHNFAKNHLKNNGILICPFRSGPLIIIKKKNNKLIKEYSQEEYGFVPLIL